MIAIARAVTNLDPIKPLFSALTGASVNRT
jgi:hypothetical protein